MIDAEKAFACRYLGTDGREIHWVMIRAALASVANTALIPMQDLLGLGSEARMNTPGEARGNWSWRASAEQFLPETAERLRMLSEISGRLPR